MALTYYNLLKIKCFLSSNKKLALALFSRLKIAPSLINNTKYTIFN